MHTDHLHFFRSARGRLQLTSFLLGLGGARCIWRVESGAYLKTGLSIIGVATGGRARIRACAEREKGFKSLGLDLTEVLHGQRASNGCLLGWEGGWELKSVVALIINEKYY